MTMPDCAQDLGPLRRSGFLEVGDGHVLAWQEQGRADGLPVLLLHGGPGSATSRRQLDLAAHDAVRLVAFDQRGCGASKPRGTTQANRTEHLVRDIEALRLHLGIDRWLIAGGSWGATLALVAASRNPATVRGVLLRNLFVPCDSELDWFFQGAAQREPVAWQRFAAAAPAPERANLLPWLADVFATGSPCAMERAALGWLGWERVLAGVPAAMSPAAEELVALVDRYRIQAHYLRHSCWLGETCMREAARSVPAVPVLFLHGRADAVCRPPAALALQRLVRGSRHALIDGGHDPFNAPMASAFRRAIESFVRQGSFDGIGHVA